MNKLTLFLAKYIQVIGLVMLAAFLSTAGILYFGLPAFGSTRQPASVQSVPAGLTAESQPAAAPLEAAGACTRHASAPAAMAGCPGQSQSAEAAGGCCASKAGGSGAHNCGHAEAAVPATAHAP